MKLSDSDKSPNFVSFLFSSCSSDALKRFLLTKCKLSDQPKEQEKAALTLLPQNIYLFLMFLWDVTVVSSGVVTKLVPNCFKLKGRNNPFSRLLRLGRKTLFRKDFF